MKPSILLSIDLKTGRSQTANDGAVRFMEQASNTIMYPGKEMTTEFELVKNDVPDVDQAIIEPWGGLQMKEGLTLGKFFPPGGDGQVAIMVGMPGGAHPNQQVIPFTEGLMNPTAIMFGMPGGAHPNQQVGFINPSLNGNGFVFKKAAAGGLAEVFNLQGGLHDGRQVWYEDDSASQPIRPMEDMIDVNLNDEVVQVPKAVVDILKKNIAKYGVQNGVLKGTLTNEHRRTLEEFKTMYTCGRDPHPGCIQSGRFSSFPTPEDGDIITRLIDQLQMVTDPHTSNNWYDPIVRFIWPNSRKRETIFSQPDKQQRCIGALRDSWHGYYYSSSEHNEGISYTYMPQGETRRTWMANNLKPCQPVSRAKYANNACDPTDGWMFQHHYHSYENDEQIFNVHGLKPEDCADVAIPYMVRPKPFDHAAETEKTECSSREIECATAALCRDHVFHIDWLGNKFDTVDPGTARGRYAQIQAENTLHRNTCPLKREKKHYWDWDKGCHGSVQNSTGTTFKDMNAHEKHAFCLDTFSTKTCTNEDKACELALLCKHLPRTAINYNNNWYRPKTHHEAGTVMASPPSIQGDKDCNALVNVYTYHPMGRDETTFGEKSTFVVQKYNIDEYKKQQNTDCMTPTNPHPDDYTPDDWKLIAEKFDGCYSGFSRGVVCDMDIVPILSTNYSDNNGEWTTFVDASGVTPQDCKAFANTLRVQSQSSS